jgi:mRNA interferase RelE/StbE
MYEIVFTKSALKELVSLPGQEVKRIVDRIDLLANDPRPHGSKKLKGLENEYL